MVVYSWSMELQDSGTESILFPHDVCLGLVDHVDCDGHADGHGDGRVCDCEADADADADDNCHLLLLYCYGQTPRVARLCRQSCPHELKTW